MRLFHVSVLKFYRLNLYCACCVVTLFVVLVTNQLNLLSVVWEASKQISIRKVVSVQSKFIAFRYQNKKVEEDITYDRVDYNATAEYFHSTDEKTEIYEIRLSSQNLVNDKKVISRHPTVLLWNSLQFPTTSIPEVDICGGGCRLTTDRDEFHLSDAVIFTMKELNLSDLPESSWRRSDQVYVWWSEESAWASKNMYKKRLRKIAKNYFNWTMTYKSDSDVNAMMIPYVAREFVAQKIEHYRALHPEHNDRDRLLLGETVLPRPKTEREVSALKAKATKFLRRKVKMAAWVASNCGYTAGAVLRRSLITKLQFLGLSVDIYGSCGNRNVAEALSDFADMLSEYRFYLAFENAFHCREYITEKFWYNSLYAGVVPVVWGPVKSDVEAIAPSNSFIHYEDFESDESLVDYLIRLKEDDEMYMKYFEWWWDTPGYFPIFGVTKTMEDVAGRSAMYDFEMNAFCHLCNLLSKGMHKKIKKSIPSLHDWWYKGESKACLSSTHNAKIKTFRSDSAKKGYKIIQV